ncbi:MAG: hypothetical protein GX660_13645 [Clostridiaceae bacterium]|nr:hypothetical protein [Clostridiaceae bacterium]
MNIESIKNKLQNSSKSEIFNVLNYINDLFESYTKIDSFEELIEILIKCAVDEDDEELRLELFDCISKASEHRSMTKVNFDLIETKLDFLTLDCLEKAIDILSFSHNKKYIETIKRYTLHENKKIAYVASIALEEIKG